ncbi:tail assembly chaperone [Mycobacterium phage MalagasyRose]|uniref:Tail assembly chaperone n=1 Tax=Mycobacterium phage MalagasyRose TaxID=2599870 RepID=A0A5J6TDH7_9CAUD|nr:tail assembly chaperone [Mycobacterium phage MalagasyRose]QFG08870.1 tail assembly chaperone [Mycobacterium phage MalagasyRose]
MAKRPPTIKPATTFDEHAADPAAEAPVVDDDAPRGKRPADPNKGIAPGSPEFDWQAEYPGEDVFVYTASNGVTVGLARCAGARKPKPGFLRQLRKAPYMEQLWTMLEIVASPAALAVSDDFEDEEYGQMFEAWSEWSKTPVGESSR